MNTQADATAVATTTQINGKDIAVHTVKTVTSAAHIGFTALANIAMYAGAHLITKIDSTQTVQDTVDYCEARTTAKLSKMNQKLSGYQAVK